MKHKHLAVLVKESNRASVVDNGDGTFTSHSWVIKRPRLGYLQTVSIHRKQSDPSVQSGIIVGYAIDPVTERISVRFRPTAQVVQGTDLNWRPGKEKAYLF